mmetsp:Transcript_132137/g.329544  ORF Transcript_132137/g.329544 Transcript_132137/m.329544 type:complete len:246 (-) Transcript_132137:665-1402(-)
MDLAVLRLAQALLLLAVADLLVHLAALLLHRRDRGPGPHRALHRLVLDPDAGVAVAVDGLLHERERGGGVPVRDAGLFMQLFGELLQLLLGVLHGSCAIASRAAVDQQEGEAARDKLGHSGQELHAIRAVGLQGDHGHVHQSRDEVVLEVPRRGVHDLTGLGEALEDDQGVAARVEVEARVVGAILSKATYQGLLVVFRPSQPHLAVLPEVVRDGCGISRLRVQVVRAREDQHSEEASVTQLLLD